MSIPDLQQKFNNLAIQKRYIDDTLKSLDYQLCSIFYNKIQDLIKSFPEWTLLSHTDFACEYTLSKLPLQLYCKRQNVNNSINYTISLSYYTDKTKYRLHTNVICFTLDIVVFIEQLTKYLLLLDKFTDDKSDDYFTLTACSLELKDNLIK